MKTMMDRIIYKSNKIFWIVLGFIFDMMNSLGLIKKSSNFLFYNKTMLIDISSTISKWMIWFKDIYITVRCYGFTALPVWIFISRIFSKFRFFHPIYCLLGMFFSKIWVIISRHPYFMINTKAFVRTKFPKAFVDKTLPSFEIFVTNQTLFNHIHIIT